MHEQSEQLCHMDNYMHNEQRIIYPTDNHAHAYVHQHFNDVVEIGNPNPIIIPTVPSAIQSKTLTSAKISQVYYSRDIDQLELKELLESWNVVELFEYFEGEFHK